MEEANQGVYVWASKLARVDVVRCAKGHRLMATTNTDGIALSDASSGAS